MMDYSEFMEYVEDNILKYLPPEYENADVELTKTLKNNNVILDTLRVHREEETASPQIYLNRAYESYREGQSIDRIMVSCAETISSAKIEPEYLDAVSHISEFETVKDQIIPRVCNAADNTEFLSSRPHRLENDLAVYYAVRVYTSGDGVGTITITNQLMKSMGVTAKDLDDAALNNISQEAYIRTGASMMLDMMVGDFSRDFGVSEAEARKMLEAQMPVDDGMWIVTNREKINGAAVIMSPMVREQIGEVVGGDYYVLPSSIHEIIIVPKDQYDSIRELTDMVKQVNQTCVNSDEVLSDNVYEYQIREKTLKLATDQTLDLEKELSKKQDQTKRL